MHFFFKSILIFFFLYTFIFQGDLDLDPNDGIDSDGSVSSNSGKQVFVGICAMSKKSQSKPMKEILTRLQEFEFLKVVVFSEDCILKVRNYNKII